MKQFSITLVTEGSCPLAIGPTLGARFGLSWVDHCQLEERLMLWTYSGGKMTQLNQFYCRLMMKLMFVPVCLNDEICSELYNLGLPAEGKNEQTPEGAEDSRKRTLKKRTLQYMITSIYQ